MYVRDVAQAISRAALEPQVHGGKTYEIAGPQVLTMAELNQAIVQLSGQNTEIVPVPDVFGDLLSRFGWMPGAPLTRDQWLMLQRDNVAAQGCAGPRGVRNRADAACRRRLGMAGPLPHGRQILQPANSFDRRLLNPDPTRSCPSF